MSGALGPLRAALAFRYLIDCELGSGGILAQDLSQQ